MTATRSMTATTPPRRTKAGLLIAALAASLTMAAGARVAHAGCGGGGGGGGGGHGGGGHGGGGHGSGSCDDSNDIVGDRRCSQFGEWGDKVMTNKLVLETGVMVRQLGSLLGGQLGSVTHGSESFAFRVATPAAGARPIDTAVVAMMRVLRSYSHGWYAGLEGDVGSIVRQAAATTEMMSTGAFGSPELAQRDGILVDELAVVGMRGEGHAGSLGVEAAGGLRVASYSFHSAYHDCEQMVSVRAFGPVAELRARGELWLSPWVTAGAIVGASVIDKGAWMGGLYIGVHSRAFGGTR